MKQSKYLLFSSSSWFFLIFCTFVPNAGCDYLSSRNFYKSLEIKNCDEARNILLKKLKKNLEDINSEYNLVHAFACSGDFPLAIQQIDSLLKDNIGYVYELNFIKGYLYGEMGEVDLALESYQKALDVKSDIKIKQNMELLFASGQSGKSGKSKKGKGKKNKDSETGDKSEGDEEDQERDSKGNKEKDKTDKNPKDGKSNKMTQKQVEKIMNEIDGDEKKVRSQGLNIKSKKGNNASDKEW